MKKWTKGILIFGLTASILGTCSMVIGLTSGGMESLVRISEKAVYQWSQDTDTIQDEISQVDVSLKNHAVSIIASRDNRVHITYSKRLSGEVDFTQEVKDGVLRIRDGKPEEGGRRLGLGLEALLQISQGVTTRHSEIVIELPRDKVLKDLKVRAEASTYQFTISDIQTEHLDMESYSYYTTIFNSQIKSGTIFSSAIMNIADSSLGDVTIRCEQYLTLDSNSISGKVEAEAEQDSQIFMKQADLDDLYYHLSTAAGKVYKPEVTRDHMEYDDEGEEEVDRPSSLESGDANSKKQLIFRIETGDLILQVVKPARLSE